MCVFLWFALFRKRTESRLFFFYGRFRWGMTHVLAYFNEISPFIVFIMFLDFLLCIIIFR